MHIHVFTTLQQWSDHVSLICYKTFSAAHYIYPDTDIYKLVRGGVSDNRRVKLARIHKDRWD